MIYGKVGGALSAKCIHGGGKFVLPLIQDYEYLDLAPRTIEIDLSGALSLKNIRVNVPSTFTVGISTRAAIMNNAAERLLGLSDAAVRSQAQDIILGQMRLVIATLSIEEINQDREKFLEPGEHQRRGRAATRSGSMSSTSTSATSRTSRGYIEAIGKKAAADAVNQARIEVAEAEQKGAIGEARPKAVREREVRVAERDRAIGSGREGRGTRATRIAMAGYRVGSRRG